MSGRPVPAGSVGGCVTGAEALEAHAGLLADHAVLAADTDETGDLSGALARLAQHRPRALSAGLGSGHGHHPSPG